VTEEKKPVIATPAGNAIYVGPGPRGTNEGPKSFNPCKPNDLIVNGETIPDEVHAKERERTVGYLKNPG
jgi:hypothetical protein